MATASTPSTSSRKLVLLGESAVGKSSLVLQFVKGQFDDYRESTIGAFLPTRTRHCEGADACGAVGAAFLTQTVRVEQGFVKFEVRSSGPSQSLPAEPCLGWRMMTLTPG